jgi:hypothetical protein
MSNHDRVAQRLAALATGLILAAVFLGSPNWRGLSGPDVRPFAGDFLQEWIGGRVVLSGDYQRFYDPAYAAELEHRADLVGFEWRSDEYLPLVYPPFYYLLVSPFALLPYHTAAVVWAIAMVAAYLLAWRILAATLRQQGTPLSPWLLPASLLFMPLIENFTTGQKASLLLLIAVGTYALLVRRRPFAAGLVFGLMAFKPQLLFVVVLAMLAKRQARFTAGVTITVSALALLCLPLGIDVCWQYVEFSRHAGEYLHTPGYALAKSHALSGFWTLLFGFESSAVWPLVGLTAAAIATGLTWTLRGPSDVLHERFRWQFSALIVATILLSPHLYTYDLTLLLLPLTLIVSGTTTRQQVRALAVALYCLVGLSPAVATATHVQGSVVLMLALFALLVRHRCSDGRLQCPALPGLKLRMSHPA